MHRSGKTTVTQHLSFQNTTSKYDVRTFLGVTVGLNPPEKGKETLVTRRNISITSICHRQLSSRYSLVAADDHHQPKYHPSVMLLCFAAARTLLQYIKSAM